MVPGSEVPISPRENPNYDSHRAVGASARDLLLSSPFNTVMIEVQAMHGFQPAPATLNNLKNFISTYCNKSSVSVVIDPDIPAQGKASYTLLDAAQIEATYRKLFTAGTTMSVYFLFLDGDSADNLGNSKILGYAHRNTSVVMFEKTINSLSGSLLQPSKEILETAVIEHEFGHLLGLVNLGTPLTSQHQDIEYGNHCNVNSPPCLMYYSVNTSDFISNLLSLGGTVPVLDPKCKADLVANGI